MMLWAVLNIVLSGTFFVLIKAPLVRAYLILNYVLIVNPPVMWELLGLAHPKFIPGGDHYADALVFMALFNSILCGSFVLLMKHLPRSKVAQRYVIGHVVNRMQGDGRLLLVTLTLAASGVAAKFGLDSMGALRMGDGRLEDAGPLLQALKTISGFDLIAVIFLGELRIASARVRPVLNLMLIGLLLLSLIVALSTGSRSQAITVMIIAMIAYRDHVRKYWYVIYPALIAVVPTIFLLFPLLAYYRIAGHDKNTALEQLEASGRDNWEVFSDVIVTRLNYHEVVARVMDYVSRNGTAGGEVYWNNFLGIIPRLIWPSKPQISNDSRELGHQLDLVTSNDTSTSIGLQVVGEAFYEFGWFGLWVALLQALIFVLIHKNFFQTRNPAAMTVYTYLAIYILQRDGYFAVLPGLIWVAIGFTIFFLIFQLFLPSPRAGSSREVVSHRRSRR